MQPDHYLVWSGRGSLYVRMGLWHSAAHDYAEAIDLGVPANNPGWWGVPQLFALVEDDESYGRTCDVLLPQIEQAQDPAFLTFAIRSLSVCEQVEADRDELAQAPKNCSRPSPECVIKHQSAGRDLARVPPAMLVRGPLPVMPPDMMAPPHGIPEYVAGLAEFRAGHYEKAIEQLNRAIAQKSPREVERMAVPVLAMAYQAIGRDEQAKRALDGAARLFDEWTTVLLKKSAESLPLPWFDFVEFVVLYREAHVRIAGGLPPHYARLTDGEQHALEMLRAG